MKNLQDELNAEIERMQHAGRKDCISPMYQPFTCADILLLAEQINHAHYVKNRRDDNLSTLEKMLRYPGFKDLKRIKITERE
jgi:hypothetical protein